MLHATMKRVFSHQMLFMILLGYCAGLPLLLIGSTLQAWMTQDGVDLTTIGFTSLLGLPYTLKFVWAPLLDRYALPFLGRRKGWMLVFQACLVAFIFALSLTSPSLNIGLVGMVAMLIGFFSASQDIVLDAYRREVLPDEDIGFGNSLYVVGYRLGMIVSGALALKLSFRLGLSMQDAGNAGSPWPQTYQIMAMCMAPALLVTIFAPREIKLAAPSTLMDAIVGPLKEYFSREGSIVCLLFILLYKVGDLMAANMTTPFMIKIGYTTDQIGDVAKLFGMVATIVGGILGGAMMLRMNIRVALVIFGILQALSTLGFALLAKMPPSFELLAGVIAFENLAAGLGMAAFGAFMLTLTNKTYTATQYALLSSLMGIPRVILPAPTGWMAQHMGWEMFFVACTLMAIPGMLLLIPIFRLEKKSATA